MEKKVLSPTSSLVRPIFKCFLIVVESTALDSQLYLFGCPLRAKHLLQKYIHKGYTMVIHETDECYTKQSNCTKQINVTRETDKLHETVTCIISQ